jgi:hypothetical protein
MSYHRATLVVLATLFTAAMSPAAFAGCCGWGASSSFGYGSFGYGSFGSGCGGCGVTYATPVVAAPVVVAPVVAAPVAYSSGCGCGGSSVVYASPVVQPTPIAPSPIYVTNQGPEFSGPGISVPYGTYSPAPAYAPPYPYMSGYRPYPRMAYMRPYRPYMGPRYYGPARWHGYPYGYPRGPLGVRG